MTNHQKLIASIQKLKKQRNTIILAHVYQRGEVQDTADYVGDSLDLNKRAVNTNADVIVFCGVQFMTEAALILNPYKTVLLPDKNAGCGLADMATDEQILKLKNQNHGMAVVSYVNSSARVKAVSDICCTSANAINVVNHLSNNNILFVPDRNLGSYVAEHTNKDIRLWNGFCYVHENIKPVTIKSLKDKYPKAEIIVHPECITAVRHMADFIGSTSQMSKYVKQSWKNEFIVGTEDNFVYRLGSDNPNKKFYRVNTLCEGMNTITLEKIKHALENMKYKVHIPEETREKAEIALDKMLTVV